MKQNKKLSIILIVIMAVSLGGMITAGYLHESTASIICKTICSLCFTAVGVIGCLSLKENKTYGRLMVLAFIGSLAGDVLLALDHGGLLFVIGVASFAAAHVLFAAAFFKMSKFSPLDIIIWAGIFAVTLGFIFFGGTFDFKGLKIVIILYAAIISFMVSKAISLRKSELLSKKTKITIIIGAVLFIASDIILLYCLFGINTPPIVGNANLLCYYSGQACLSLSVGMSRKNKDN